MLAFDDPRWEKTRHCYGSGKEIPKTLRKIETARSLKKAFWDDFGNTLCHQCTIGSASIAAFPHLVRIADDNYKNAKGFDSLKLASLVLIFTIGPENQIPKMDSFLRKPFAKAIEDGKNVICKMLPLRGRPRYQNTMNFLEIIAAFDGRSEIAMLLATMQNGWFDCPRCEERILESEMYSF